MIGKTFISRMGTRAKVVRVEKNRTSQVIHMELDNGFKFASNYEQFKKDWNETVN